MKPSEAFIFFVSLMFLLGACSGGESEEANEQEIAGEEEAAEEEEVQEKPANLSVTPTSVGDFEIGITVDELKEKIPDTYRLEDGELPPVAGDVFVDNYRIYEGEEQIFGIFVSVENPEKIIGYRVYSPKFKTEEGIYSSMPLQELKEKVPEAKISYNMVSGGEMFYFPSGMSFDAYPDKEGEELGVYQGDGMPEPTKDYKTAGKIGNIEIFRME